MSTSSNLVRLKTAVQEYDWGKTGSASLAARLAPNSVGSDFKVDEKKSYAEIWMGTHPNGPSSLFDSPSTSLYSVLESSPSETLGAVAKKWPNTKHLPFLFKILSIEKALPLQGHPDKALAERLRADNPDLAPDDNHKPEIAVAIGEPLRSADSSLQVGGPDTAFTGFVGFRPLAAIQQALKAVPELRAAVGDEKAVELFFSIPSKESLKKVYAALLHNWGPAERHVKALGKRVRESIGAGKGAGAALGDVQDAEQLGRLVVKVEKQYPGDVGAFATVFFMNFTKLRKGEAIYIGADEVHAYLEGDIIECMAVSDNVLNAAFAPPEERREQIPKFVQMLTYTSRPASHWALPQKPYALSANGATAAYDPPLEEFVVMGTALGGRTRMEKLGKVDGPTVGIVTRGVVEVRVLGESMVMQEGAVVFVKPGNEIEVQLVKEDAKGGAEVWWSTCAA